MSRLGFKNESYLANQVEGSGETLAPDGPNREH
jgi:hypothetical protein